MKRLQFLKEGLKDVWTVGTFVRSSKFMGRRIARNIDFTNAKCVVELGAGDGAITARVLEAMPVDCKLMAFELNPAFAERLRKIEDDRLMVIEDNAEKMGEYLEKYGYDKADTIVSTLPLIMFPEDQAIKLITIAKANLREGSKYIQIHYSLLAKNCIKEYSILFLSNMSCLIYLPYSYIFVPR